MRNHADEVFAKFRRTVPPAAEMGSLPYKSEQGKWIASPYDGNSWRTGRHTNITYGDYFLVEVIAKMNGTAPVLWL